jgi:ABC-type microcin C transport system permease subunit YejB
LKEKKVSIIQVNETGEWPGKDKNKFREWLQNHYTHLHFEALKGETENVLFDHLFKRKNMFLVMGAYGRTSLSRFFKRSHADLLINTVTQPIFIAHP